MKKFILITGIVLASCHNKNSNDVIMSLDDTSGVCPYITKDAKGNIVISWARAVNDSDFVFCYAVSLNGGKSFEKPVIIPGSNNLQPHSENLPKIIFKPTGEAIALWGAANPNPKNKYSGLVFYSQSFDRGKTWSQPTPLVKDTASYDQRYYDVAMLPGGEAAVIWLDNRKTSDKEGSSLYYATTRGADGFMNEQKISEGCCECCRTDLYIDSKSAIHVLYRGIIKDSIRDMVHSVSTDGGATFSEPKVINKDNWVIKGCPHTGPAMTENKKGLNFAWFTGGAKRGCFYSRSTDNGNTFTGLDKISALGSHPQMASLNDGRIIIVWDEPVPVTDLFNRQIAVQVRSADGISQIKQLITPDSLKASYPVITTINDRTSIIAYTVKTDNKDFVKYQLVDF